MAAATIISQRPIQAYGHDAVKHYLLDEPANTNTLETPFRSIHSVQVCFASAGAAADSVSAVVTGSTITFTVIGTARDLWVTVYGLV